MHVVYFERLYIFLRLMVVVCFGFFVAVFMGFGCVFMLCGLCLVVVI